MYLCERIPSQHQKNIIFISFIISFRSFVSNCLNRFLYVCIDWNNFNRNEHACWFCCYCNQTNDSKRNGFFYYYFFFFLVYWVSIFLCRFEYSSFYVLYRVGRFHSIPFNKRWFSFQTKDLFFMVYKTCTLALMHTPCSIDYFSNNCQSCIKSDLNQWLHKIIYRYCLSHFSEVMHFYSKSLSWWDFVCFFFVIAIS